MMQVDYLILADAAAALEGKHYIHGGGWDIIRGAAFPIQQSLAVAVRLSVDWHETNEQQTIELDVHNEDGRSVLPVPPGPMRGSITVGRPPHLHPGDEQHLPIVLNLVGVSFEAAGKYVVIMRINGQDAKRASFRVVDITAP
jgi:hypothetical protein